MPGKTANRMFRCSRGLHMWHNHSLPIHLCIFCPRYNARNKGCICTVPAFARPGKDHLAAPPKIPQLSKSSRTLSLSLYTLPNSKHIRISNTRVYIPMGKGMSTICSRILAINKTGTVHRFVNIGSIKSASHICTSSTILQRTHNEQFC